MKFERLLKNPKYLTFLKNKYQTSRTKIQKLKLGLVRFEIKEIYFSQIKIFEQLEMKYVRQDLQTDTSFIDNINSKLFDTHNKTHNFIKHFINLILILIIGIVFFKLYFSNYINPADKNLQTVLNFVLNFFFKSNVTTSFHSFSQLNEDFVSIICDFCSLYGVII